MTLQELYKNEHFVAIKTVFPRIADSIELFWGHDGFDEIISKLIKDSRDGERQGFPNEVSTALFKLMSLHDSSYPQFRKEMTPIAHLNDIANRRD